MSTEETAPPQKPQLAKRPREGTDDAKTFVKKRKTYDEKPARATRRDERRDLLTKAKEKWEGLRAKATKKDKAKVMTKELYDLIKGRIPEIVFRHDGSRIIQCLLNAGSPEVRKAVLADLLSEKVMSAEEQAAADATRASGTVGLAPTSGTLFSRLVADRYARHLAMKVMKSSDAATRSQIFNAHIQPHVRTLVRHVHSAHVLDVAYSTMLNASARAQLVLSILFARERMHWKQVHKTLFETDTEAEAATGPTGTGGGIFAQALGLIAEEFHGVVIDSAYSVIAALVEKDVLLTMEVMHAVVKEWLMVAIERCDAEKARTLAFSLAAELVHFGHTKSGMWVAVTCVKLLDAKHRKKVVRSVRGHVRKLAMDEFGHCFLISLQEWVDDTRLLGKVLSTELCTTEKVVAEVPGGADEADAKGGDEATVVQGKSRGGRSRAEKKGKVNIDNIENKSQAGQGDDDSGIDVEWLFMLCKHRHGRMVLLNLLFGQETRYFNPDRYGIIWNRLDEEKYGVTSKKDAETRRKELRAWVESGVSRVVKEHMKELMEDVRAGVVLVGAGLHEGMQAEVRDGLVGIFGDEMVMKDTLGKGACRRTIAAVFKVGGHNVCDEVASVGGGSELIRKLWAMKCFAVARCLAQGSGDVALSQVIGELGGVGDE